MGQKQRRMTRTRTRTSKWMQNRVGGLEAGGLQHITFQSTKYSSQAQPGSPLGPALVGQHCSPSQRALVHAAPTLTGPRRAETVTLLEGAGSELITAQIIPTCGVLRE